jgi:hypothetical protein
MAPYETMPHMSKDYESWAIDNGTHVMVPNPNKMISAIAQMTRANAPVLESRGVDERLDP